MFISTKEKNQMLHKIASLELSVQGLYTSLRFIEQTLHDIKNKPKKQKTPQQKAKQAEYMKMYNARKKAEKAAQLKQVIA